MELRVVLLVNIALTTLSAAIPIIDILFPAPANVFHQKLDHFDPDNQEYFKQRYFKRDFSSHDGAPIFLEIGGESAQTGYFLGLLYEIASKNRGVIMALEHRYYGESVPERGPKYLSSEQALADIANFIQAQKKLYPNSPWIVSGCSYAGNLATWMRLKYPHLVQGAIAGSAPVLAKVDFYEYEEIVGEVIKKKAPLCHQKLVEANEELTTLAKTLQGQRKLAKMFRHHVYEPIFGKALRQDLAERMAFANGTHIQDLKYYRPFTSEVCNLITRNTRGKSTLEILINKLVFNGITNTVESVIRRDLDIGLRTMSPIDYDMWHYQMCHEFGYFKSLSSKKQPFGEGLDINLLVDRRCKKWNIDLEMVKENVRKTNLRYGGKTPNVTNVVFMYGTHDPWHPLGVLRDLSSSARTFIFQGLSHCEFYYGRFMFFEPDERIPEWMKMLDEIESIVRSWFQDQFGHDVLQEINLLI